MKRKEYSFVIEHEFADGTKMTDEEFMSKPFVVDCALNKQVMEDISIILTSKHKKRLHDKYVVKSDRERAVIEQLDNI
jgi:hypothetical protein